MALWFVSWRVDAHFLRSLAPHLTRELDDHPELRPLLLLGQHVALFRRGEAALRRDGELVETRELGRFLDAALDVVLLLQRAALGGDEAEHHDLVALGPKAQRLEAAGTLGVVFEEIAVVVHLAEQRLRHWFVA